MYRSILLIAATAAFFMCSCKHYCHNNPYPVLKFVGFDSADLNTVVVSSHNTSEGGPTTLPAQHVAVYTSRRTMASDTMNFGTNDSLTSSWTYLISLDFNTDATIYIPVTGRTYNLRGYAPHRDSWESVNCTNSMSYYLNDTLYTQPMQPGMQAQGFILINR